MTLIVVVDDQATNRTIYARIAAAIAPNVEVVAFADPEQALGWLETNRPDLVITDYKMPGVDGAEFVRRLHVIYPGGGTPVIVVTAYVDRELRLRALKAGATDFLCSPVDPREFVTRGRNVLQLGRQQKAVRSWADSLQRELVRSEELIENSRQRLKQVIDTIPALVHAVDGRGRRVFENLRHGLMPQRTDPAVEAEELMDRQIFQGEQDTLSYEEELTDSRGECRCFLTGKYPLFDADGLITHVLTTSFDISERKRAEREMDYLAHHDALTDLPNRRLLLATLDTALRAIAQGGESFALHLIDLDRFKSINDGFGHNQGDALLSEVARRLKSVVSSRDLVARLGGDEFAVLQYVPAGVPDAEHLAERMIEAVSRPLQVESYYATIGASIGITIAPADGCTSEQLLKAADLAMYQAKQDGRGRACFFEREMQALARNNIVVEIELRKAIEEDEFVLHYQPQVDLATGTMVGVEALLRWEHFRHGLLLPGQFLPLAEETGLIVLIDELVLRKACAQAAEWDRRGRPITVGVNLSPATLRSRSVLEMVQRTLAEEGLAPSLLELELTEGALMQTHQDIAVELQSLRQLGVRIAIDDFGTGYSSLAYLQRLPIDRLKIDKSFVEDLPTRLNGSAIVRAIVGIGRSLNVEVLAEGVETTCQMQQVKVDGCSVVQGFLIGRPVEAEQLFSLPVRIPETASSSQSRSNLA